MHRPEGVCLRDLRRWAAFAVLAVVLLLAATPARAVDAVNVRTDASAIDLTENGDTVVESTVWTGTNPGGDKTSVNCQDWKGSGTGRVGSATATDIRWTNDKSEDCAKAFHVYCIEE